MKYNARITPMCLVGILGVGLIGPQEADAAEPIVEKLEHGQINWTDKVIVATGSGAPNVKLPNVARVRLEAERAAKLDAYRNIVEALKGVRIDSTQTGKGPLARNEIRTQVQGIVARCKVKDTRYYSDGGVDVVVRCPLDGGLATILAPVKDRVKVSGEGKQVFSGLVIDAVGTKVQPALAPRVVDGEGKLVYGSNMVGPNFLRQFGAASFVRTLEQAKANSRVGKNPLVIKAAALGAQPTELSLSAEEAGKLAGQNLSFLAEGRVVIVTDGP